MRDITVADVEYRELLGGGGRLGEADWWNRYNSFMLQLDESIEESVEERGYRALEAYGMSRGRSVSSLVRDAVEEYLERRGVDVYGGEDG